MELSFRPQNCVVGIEIINNLSDEVRPSPCRFREKENYPGKNILGDVVKSDRDIKLF